MHTQYFNMNAAATSKSPRPMTFQEIELNGFLKAEAYIAYFFFLSIFQRKQNRFSSPIDHSI